MLVLGLVKSKEQFEMKNNEFAPRIMVNDLKFRPFSKWQLANKSSTLKRP